MLNFNGKSTRENRDVFNSSCFSGRSSSLFGREKHVLMTAMYGSHIFWMPVQIGDQKLHSNKPVRVANYFEAKPHSDNKPVYFQVLLQK